MPYKYLYSKLAVGIPLRKAYRNRELIGNLYDLGGVATQRPPMYVTVGCYIIHILSNR